MPKICDQKSIDEIAAYVDDLLAQNVAPFLDDLKPLANRFGSAKFKTEALLPDIELS